MARTFASFRALAKATNMKTVYVIAALALALAGCNEDKGVHLGTFKDTCAAKSGTLAQVSSNEYTCTLPDGSVLKTADKK